MKAEDDDIEPMLSFGDAYEIGERIVEMADRVRVADKVVPGTAARWGFEIDGTRYEVTLRVAPPEVSNEG